MKVILIDSGTSNSRVRLIDDNQKNLIDVLKINIGVRNTAIDGDNIKLKKGLKKMIEDILKRNQLIPSDISYIVASGMITSNLGIYEVPHITSPASIKDFVKNSVVIELEEFLTIPCIFIPGMKNEISGNKLHSIADINNFDVMRGEEVETIGLLNQINVKGKGIMVLPGSHTKFVIVDEQKRLVSCLSTLGGEVLQAVQKETILSKSLNHKLIDVVNTSILEKGYETAEKHGLTRSFYHIRLLELFSELDENERANYFVGSLICDDIKALLQTVQKEEINWIIVGGSNPLKKAYFHILKYLNLGWDVMEASELQVENCMIHGAQEIASNYIASSQMNGSVN